MLRRQTAGPPEPGRGPEQFAAFYRAHFDAVLGSVARRVDGPHTAADLTADVFLAAWEHRASYDPRRGVPQAWLYGIARRVVAGNTRSSARELRAVSRISGQRLLDDADIAALEERLDAERAARDLLARHAALSEPLRAVLDLVVIDGLTPQECAVALGISRASVRVRLHRARRALAATAHTPTSARTETMMEATP